MEYQRDEHRVHRIVYHLIWTPKRRKKVLVGAIAKDCDQLIRQKCDEQGWKIRELAIQPDHIHRKSAEKPLPSGRGRKGVSLLPNG